MLYYWVMATLCSIDEAGCGQPQLTTDRLILRAFRDDDWPTVHTYGKRAETSTYMDWGPNTKEDTCEFVQRCRNASNNPVESGWFYAIVLKAEDRVIGGCDLAISNKLTREATLGYALDSLYWRQGYTSEAALRLVQFGFEALGLHRITSNCDIENVGSWRVMQRIGMRREAHLREAKFFKDRWRDWLEYAILDREWQRSLNSVPTLGEH